MEENKDENNQNKVVINLGNADMQPKDFDNAKEFSLPIIFVPKEQTQKNSKIKTNQNTELKSELKSNRSELKVAADHLKYPRLAILLSKLRRTKENLPSFLTQEIKINSKIIFIKDHFHLLFKSAKNNYERINSQDTIRQLAEQDATKEMAEANLKFKSFNHLEKYQKKVRLITYGFSSTLAAIVIIALLVQLFLAGSSKGATYHFNQTSWSGGATANNATHASNQTNWNQYSAKDSTVDAGSGGVSLNQKASQTVTDNGLPFGSLTALSPATIATGGNGPKGITIFADGTSVYVPNMDSNTVSMYSRNTSTGALTALSPATIATGTNPSSITISVDGASVYVANYTSNNISMYSRNTSTGALTAISPATIAAGTTPVAITISADGSSVYVANSGSATVSQYSRNVSTGALTALSPATVAAGTNPYDVTISTDGTSVYVANSGSANISMYSRNTSTGALTALSPATIAAGTTPQAITISVDGTSVYAGSNNTSGTVSMYNRNTSTGALTALSPATIDSGARTTSAGIKISADGTSVYVANWSSNTVSMYSRNSSTGALTALSPATISAGSSPQGIAVSADGKFLYASSYGSKDISMYSRNATSPGFTNGTLSSTAISGSGASATVGLTPTGIETTTSLAYTGSLQSWTVPAGVTSISITTKGGGAGSAGGSSVGTLAVTSGNSFYVLVGGAGSAFVSGPTAGGYGGGGAASLYGGTGGGMSLLTTQGYATSASSITIGTGSKTFAVSSGLSFTAGKLVLIVDSAAPANWMIGGVTSYSGTTLVVNSALINGSGTFTTWTIDQAVIIAGGGGGSTLLTTSGSGGGSSGTDGSGGTAGSGRGGTSSAGGSGGSGYGTGSSGASGVISVGGAGGAGSNGGGGGGGGGYYGGGGGGGTSYGVAGPGGGGSGYVSSTLTGASTTAGAGAAAGANGSASIVYTTTTYPSTGIFTSGVINTGAPSVFSTLSYVATLNSQTIAMDARAGNTATPDSTWTDWTTGIASGGSISALSGNQYIQYRANLSTIDIYVTPTLSSVTINYVQYNSSGTLTSSIYNSESAANVIGNMFWNASSTSATETVKFQMRAASSAGGITSAAWCGTSLTCDGASYFTESTGSTLPDGHPLLQGGGADQYFQYKVFLTSGGAVTPTVTSTTVDYVVNARPDFDTSAGTGVTATQVSDSASPNWGKIAISYSIRDTDTTTGNVTQDYVTPSFEYTLNGTDYVALNMANVTLDPAPAGGELLDKNSDGTLDNKVLEGSYLTYSIVWDAKTQLPDTYSDDFKIRVTVNDNESALNIATATNATATTIDTKVPAVGTHPILIDATTAPATATLDASDDSTLKMEVNLTDSFSTVLTTPYTGSPTITLATDPDTVYVKFQDIYGNTTATSYSTTTPETPDKVMVQDTSNVKFDPAEPRMFVAWKTIAATTPTFASYKVYRSEDETDWELKDTILARTTNYYADGAVTKNQDYYYKLVAIDTDGNKSYNSLTLHGNPNGIQDAGEGGGGVGTTATPPVITSVTSSNITTTQATITWNTDLLSNSTVGFSNPTEELFINEIGVSSMKNDASHQGQHQVTLTGLTPNTIYKYQAISQTPDSATATNDNGAAGYTFTTLPGPAISNVTVGAVQSNEITISWETTTNSSTQVVYATAISEDNTLSSPITVGSEDLVGGSAPYNHEQTITGLDPDTTYYFYVKSIDADHNVATDNNANNYYSFNGETDTTDPIISDIEEAVLTYNQAAIHWITDEPATTQIKYKKSGASSYTNTPEISSYDTSHYVIINNLIPDTKYYYQVISRDISGNSKTATEEDFTTLVNEEFDHDAISEIDDIEVPTKNLSDTNAVITFTTDQAALCLVELTTSQGNYSNPINAFENGYDNEVNYNKSHTIRLVDLIYSTPYYYKISCHDNIIDEPTAEGSLKFQNWVFSEEEAFATLEEQIAASGVATGDTTKPEISGVSVESITGESVTITWDTDENGNSSVRYGLDSNYGDMAGDDTINLDTANYSKAHTVIVRGLIPATKYYFTTSSTDPSGNIGESSESSFTTAKPSSLSSIKVESKNLGEATITWQTESDSTSVVEYGLTTSYGDKKENTNYTQDHSISLSNLDQGVTYHYRVKGTDENNNLYASADNTFEPKSPPKISETNINSVTEHGATITFTTNVPTDANVTYTDTQNDKETGSQGIRELSTKHKIVLTNLKQGTTYKISLSAKDEQGSEGKKDAQDFTTGKDENPPKIENVHTDSALTQSDKVQTIISWKTDEQATSSIVYREGRAGEEKEFKNTENLSTNHVVVITSFKTGAVYNFRVKSADASGNTQLSEYFSFLTPKMRENIIQIITNNFMEIFNWTGKVMK